MGCTALALSEYTNRHNNVAVYIHWMIWKLKGLQVTENYYEYIPERVINVNSTTIMWDIPVITDWTILANWPDVVLHDKKEKTCLLIDIAIPDISNFNVKLNWKTKYQDLEIELRRMWNVRTKIVLIMRTLGAMQKRLERNLQLLPGHPSAIELQKIKLMSTAHLVKGWSKLLWSPVEIWTYQKTVT